MDRRLKQAAWLLSTTKLPIADVAVSVGYENTSFFYRIFKGKYGMSPRDYRLKGDAKSKHLKK
jgi:transcriptional regulator GlxA family with amidase domain